MTTNYVKPLRISAVDGKGQFQQFRESDDVDPPALPIGFDVNQSSHGYSALQPIYWNSSTGKWELAKSDDEATNGTHIILEIVDSNNFVAVKIGRYYVSSHGLTPGETYYTSNTTAGSLTTTEPTTGWSNPMIMVEDSDYIHVLTDRPLSVSATYSNEYAENASVPSSTETSLVSFAIPAGKVFTLMGASGTGTCSALFRLKVDGSTESLKRTAWNDRNADFEIRISGIAEGIVVSLTVWHNSPTAESFYGNVYGQLQ